MHNVALAYLLKCTYQIQAKIPTLCNSACIPGAMDSCEKECLQAITAAILDTFDNVI